MPSPVEELTSLRQALGAGPRLLIKPKKRGVIQVWVTVNGVRSLNTIKLRVS